MAAPRGKPFDGSKPGPGRGKGVLNKVTVEVKEACAQLVDDPAYRAGLQQRLREGALAPALETMLWYYAKGKPKEIIEHQGTLTSALSDAELKARVAALVAELED